MKWSFKVKYWRKRRYSAGPKVHGKVTSSPIWNEAFRQRSKAIVITVVKPPALILESFFVPHSRWNRIFFSEHTPRTHHAVLKAHARCIGLLHHRCWLFSIKVIILDIDLKLCHHTPGHRNSVEPESGDWMTEYCYLGLHFFLLDIFFNDVDSTDLIYQYNGKIVLQLDYW